MEISTTSGVGGATCTLLDQPIGFICLATLLGVGRARLGKKSSGAPDLRQGRRPHRSRPGTWTVDGFLQVAYDAIAETLPDECLGPKENQTHVFNGRWKVPTQSIVFANPKPKGTKSGLSDAEGLRTERKTSMMTFLVIGRSYSQPLRTKKNCVSG